MQTLYHFLDTGLMVFHPVLILFNLFGWIWRKTRRYNLLSLLLTAFSWLILGIWYGIGYCPCTDWHWQIRYALGYHDMPTSYIKFLIDTIFGINSDPGMVDALTGILFGLAVICSAVINYRDLKKDRLRIGTG